MEQLVVILALVVIAVFFLAATVMSASAKSIDDFYDKVVKYAVFTLFIAVFAGIFYSGYYAGQTGRWWMGLIVLLLYPALNKILSQPPS